MGVALSYGGGDVCGADAGGARGAGWAARRRRAGGLGGVGSGLCATGAVCCDPFGDLLFEDGLRDLQRCELEGCRVCFGILSELVVWMDAKLC